MSDGHEREQKAVDDFIEAVRRTRERDALGHESYPMAAALIARLDKVQAENARLTSEVSRLREALEDCLHRIGNMWGRLGVPVEDWPRLKQEVADGIWGRAANPAEYTWKLNWSAYEEAKRVLAGKEAQGDSGGFTEPTPLSAEGYTVESYVREEMDERDWSLKDLARHSGLSVERLGQFLHLGMWGDDIAPALEMAFGVDAQTWTNLWLADVGRELERQAQATEIAALKGALEAKEREMLAEHSSAMQALLRWCAEDTPEDIRKGWEQESHEALRALAAGRPR